MKSPSSGVSTQTEQSDVQLRMVSPSSMTADEGWEIVSAEGCFVTGVIQVTNYLSESWHRRSSSVPDLRYIESLDAVAEGESTEGAYDAKPQSSSAWGNPVSSIKKVSSFHHVLSSLDNEVGDAAVERQGGVLMPLKRNKIKPKFVVAPIRRCTKSTGDLQFLAIMTDEVIGEQDAMEFYAQKSAGRKGRQNGQKIRPDEAKRREIILTKKSLQRQGQS
jgi:hypothetical protein